VASPPQGVGARGRRTPLRSEIATAPAAASMPYSDADDGGGGYAGGAPRATSAGSVDAPMSLPSAASPLASLVPAGDPSVSRAVALYRGHMADRLVNTDPLTLAELVDIHSEGCRKAIASLRSAKSDAPHLAHDVLADFRAQIYAAFDTFCMREKQRSHLFCQTVIEHEVLPHVIRDHVTMPAFVDAMRRYDQRARGLHVNLYAMSFLRDDAPQRAPWLRLQREYVQLLRAYEHRFDADRATFEQRLKMVEGEVFVP
jgi:hypothetical protein